MVLWVFLSLGHGVCVLTASVAHGLRRRRWKKAGMRTAPLAHAMALNWWLRYRLILVGPSMGSPSSAADI